MVWTPRDFGEFSNTILVGNFGSGWIAAFNGFMQNPDLDAGRAEVGDIEVANAFEVRGEGIRRESKVGGIAGILRERYKKIRRESRQVQLASGGAETREVTDLGERQGRNQE